MAGREVRSSPRFCSPKLYNSGFTFTALSSMFLLIFKEIFSWGNKDGPTWPISTVIITPGQEFSFHESPAFTEQVCPQDFF